MQKVVFYVDGSSRPNPGAMTGGIVAVSGSHRREWTVNMGDGTNQRAELLVIDRALRKLKGELSQYEVVVFTDSEYAIGCLQKNWKITNQENREAAEFVRFLIKQCGSFRMEHVRGHAGVSDNERAHALASR
jgi:ribonuclease HI